MKVAEAVGRAADRARAGEGPTLVESEFYRLSAHGNVITVPPVPTQFPDHEAVAVYGNKAEFQEWKAKDPIPLFRARLIREGTLTQATAEQIERQARAEIDDAVQFALASPLPEPEEAVSHVYA